MMEKVVATEAGAGGLRLYFHDGESFRSEVIPFYPYALLTAAAAEIPDCEIIPLAGAGEFCRAAVFPSVAAYEKVLPELKKNNAVMVIRDLQQQALGISGERLFSGMEFSGLRRMQFAVTAADNGKTVAGISVRFNGKTADFTGSESEVICRFNSEIKKCDPDVLEGFNICRVDLPLLTKRAKALGITFDCGRNGEGFAMRASRFSAADKQISYNRFSLGGRHIIDLMHVVILYDAVHRDLEEFETDTLKEYFHLTTDSLTEFSEELSAMLTPAYFYRTRELPLGYQDCILRGSGSALDALFAAEYIRAGHAVPYPETSRRYTGALSEAEAHGLFHNVCHCDVRSLYPSLLLMTGKSPARDELGIFLSRLARLRRFRLEAKDRMRTLPPGRERGQLEALQSSFKILINSFYGYLGFAQGCFNDYSLAETITAAGRNLLKKLVNRLTELGASVVEMDTDGIYFQMPENSGKEFYQAVTDVLPEGIDLEFDACYPAMYSYKAKNYALLNTDGSVSLTGAALKSRALEPFQRRFILETVTALLNGRKDETESVYRKYSDAVSNRTLSLEDFAKSEVLSDSPENYLRKLESGTGRRSAAYELALHSGKKYRAGDKVRFYVTGTKAVLPVVGNSRLLDDASPGTRDENVAYYLAKLEALRKMFQH